MDLKSGYPFWRVTNGLLGVYPSLQRDIECEIAVIGGGVTGALIAHHLVEAGLSTVLLDKREFGWGSTAASTALLQYELDVPLHELARSFGESHAVRCYRVCLEAIGKLERLTKKLHSPCGFKRRSSLYLASRRRDAKVLRAEHAIRVRNGFRVELWTPAEIEAAFPFRRPAALFTRDAGQVDPYRLTHALIRRATNLGLRAFDRTEITRNRNLGRGGGRSGVELGTARGCRIRARRVVYATGYETQEMLKQRGTHLRSTYGLVSEPIDDFTGWHKRCLIWESSRPYLYLRTTEDGRAIVGGEDTSFDNAFARDALLGKKTRKLEKRFRKLFPDIKLETAFSWGGTFADTQDGLPYIGEHPDYQNAIFALCYGGNGTPFGIVAADIVRDICLGRPNKDAYLFAFDR
ncbi:MAG: NAD(P)/FAD-dependent oxidoreductase, partial [Gemmatimonadaceae bacterium]